MEEKLSIRIISLILLGFVVLISGCGDTSIVSSVAISPATASVGTNNTQQFTATAYNAAGTPVSATFTWSLSGSGGTINQSGLFTAGSSVATLSVSAAHSGFTATATISVITTGSIAGTITNSATSPVSGIGINLNGAASTSTNSSGYYSVSGLAPGSYEVVTDENILYISVSKEVTVATGEVANGNITLIDRIKMLPAYESISPTLVSGKIINNGSTQATGVTVAYSFIESDGITVNGIGTTLVGTMAAGETKTYSLIPSWISGHTYSTITKVFAAAGY